MNPDVWSFTWNVWVTDEMMPDWNASMALAVERSAALMPPGNIDPTSCRFEGATPALNPVDAVGYCPA